MLRISVACLGLLAWIPLAAATLEANDLNQLRQAEIGALVQVADLPISETQSGPVDLQRFEVYAPDARLWRVDEQGSQPIPRSSLHFFIATGADAPRLVLWMQADGSELGGVIATGRGPQSIESSAVDGAYRLSLRPQITTAPDGSPVYFACENDTFRADAIPLPQKSEVDAYFAKAPLGGLRSAVVAYDTDVELLTAPRFSSGNAVTNVTNHLASLTAAMSVVYERDLDVRLTQGHTIVRSGSDPYPSTSASSTTLQLEEFGTEWMNNQAAQNRAFAAIISGKSGNDFSAAGVAWVLGDSNMCGEKGFNCPNPNCGSCADGACTVGHYSVNRIFRFNGASVADDLMIVAHEIGHNFGASHTHCTDTSGSAGLQPIDQCFNSEGGCYSGAKSCPTPTTINGVTNVEGTLMSYCHLSGIAGCDSFPVFHPVHETALRSIADSNVTSGCFLPVAGATISIADASRTEGDSGSANLGFTLTRTSASGTASVKATTSAGTATAGSDYTTLSNQTVNFANGSATATVNVPILGDTLDEDNETFTVALSDASVGFSIDDGSATGTINDNDDPPTISVNSPTAVTEGSTISFTVSLNTASGRAVSVNHASAGGTASSGADFTPSNGTTQIAAGALNATVNVNTALDSLDEASPETFTLTLSAPSNATLGTAVGTGSILDDDEPPQVSIGDAPSIGEGGNLIYPVTLSAASGRTVSVLASTADGTASSTNGDYTPIIGQPITFVAGDTSESFVVTSQLDNLDEDNETVLANLATPTNTTINDGSGSGSITDDDPLPTLSIANASQAEGQSGSSDLSFTVSLSPVSGRALSVNYATSNGSASAGSDYSTSNGTLNFAAGETSKAILVPISGDSTFEGDETFTITLSAPNNASLGTSSATGTIVNDDGGPAVSIADGSLVEGSTGANGDMSFTISMAGGALGVPVSVDYATAALDATAGNDFSSESGTATIAAGATSTEVGINILGDNIDEFDEQFRVVLSATSSSTLGDSEATGTIIDDDNGGDPIHRSGFE